MLGKALLRSILICIQLFQSVPTCDTNLSHLQPLTNSFPSLICKFPAIIVRKAKKNQMKGSVFKKPRIALFVSDTAQNKLKNFPPLDHANFTMLFAPASSWDGGKTRTGKLASSNNRKPLTCFLFSWKRYQQHTYHRATITRENWTAAKTKWINFSFNLLTDSFSFPVETFWLPIVIETGSPLDPGWGSYYCCMAAVWKKSAETSCCVEVAPKV